MTLESTDMSYVKYGSYLSYEFNYLPSGFQPVRLDHRFSFNWFMLPLRTVREIIDRILLSQRR